MPTALLTALLLTTMAPGAEDTAQARAEGSAPHTSDNESVNIKALQREVLSHVLTELELLNAVGEDPDGGHIWWSVLVDELTHDLVSLDELRPAERRAASSAWQPWAEDELLVGFLHGDPREPVVLGGLRPGAPSADLCIGGGYAGPCEAAAGAVYATLWLAADDVVFAVAWP